MNEYQYADSTPQMEHSPEAIVSLLKASVITREEARRLLGLYDEAQQLCHK